MGERKGQQKYYPPDWRPEHGSLDNYYGTHPLRDRARKLDRGILIIRFEMPYNIWCDGCNNHIGMGVRYNAEKTKVGMYYSTPIYKFRMKCVYCPTHIEMQTDPKNCDYTVISGGRRQNNRWLAQDAEQIEAVEYNEKQRLRNDAMFNLDYGEKDKQRAEKQMPSLAEIYHVQKSNWQDCYQANSNLRKQFRQEKKQLEATEKADRQLVSKLNLNFDLVAESTTDKIVAKQTMLDKQCSNKRPLNKKPVSSTRSLGVKLSSKAVRLKAIKKSMNVSSTKSKPISSLFSGPRCKKSSKVEGDLAKMVSLAPPPKLAHGMSSLTSQEPLKSEESPLIACSSGVSASNPGRSSLSCLAGSYSTHSSSSSSEEEEEDGKCPVPEERETDEIDPVDKSTTSMISSLPSHNVSDET